MSNGTVTLEQIHEDILFLKREIEEVKEGIDDIKDIELEVKPEYLEKNKNRKKSENAKSGKKREIN